MIASEDPGNLAQAFIWLSIDKVTQHRQGKNRRKNTIRDHPPQQYILDLPSLKADHLDDNQIDLDHPRGLIP